LSLGFQDQDPEFIIGGSELDENVWDTSRRYLVATNEVDPDDGTMDHDCTASMISRRVVLLAAREFRLTTYFAPALGGFL
jgi:hypothetical protein